MPNVLKCFLDKVFIKSKQDFKMKKFLIVGLGNVGAEYDNTRHNIGFSVLDLLASKQSTSFSIKRQAEITRFNNKGRQFILVKPTTFMNLSGKAVQYWLQKENVPKENLLVVTDDLNLPFGTLRLKTKGSDGGHNGLKDIQNKLNTSQYHRLRFGIGNGFSKGQQVNHVLGQWETEEQQKLQERLQRATEMVISFVMAGAKATMDRFNGT
jgi:PTH1 family peptidyl-tRNA hydrolase